MINAASTPNKTPIPTAMKIASNPSAKETGKLWLIKSFTV